MAEPVKPPTEDLIRDLLEVNWAGISRRAVSRAVRRILWERWLGLVRNWTLAAALLLMAQVGFDLLLLVRLEAAAASLRTLVRTLLA